MRQRAKDQQLKTVFQTYFIPQKWKLVRLLLLILLGVAIGNVGPYLYGRMLDSITSSQLRVLVGLIAAYFCVTLAAHGLSLLEGYCGEMLSFRLSNQIKTQMFDRILGMRLRDSDRYTPGELISRLNGDTESIVDFYLDLISNLGQIAVTLGISLYFVVRISMRLSTVALFYIPATFLVTYLSRKYYRRLAVKQKKLNDRYYSFQNEAIANIPGVKSFHLERRMGARYRDIVQEKLALTKRAYFLKSAVSSLNNVIMLLSSMFIIYLSAVLIRDNLLTIGAMVSFNTYINKLFSSAETIWSINVSKQAIAVSVERVYELLDRPEEYGQAGGAPLTGGPPLELDGVSFGYQEDSPVLRDLDLTISSCGFYSFVGKNGCGKSTLAKLLMRFYEPDSGQIRLAGQPVGQVDLASLRGGVTYIPRDDFFLKDTIRQNLLLAREDATEEELRRACRQAGIDGHIMSLPEQYDTVIGQGGSTLSSGQRQKLNIARALLRQTGVMIFDEITANLDGGAEQEVLSVLKELSAQAVILVISHKASSIALSDRIFVMDQGRVVDSGTHDELLAKNGMYQELFKYSVFS